MKLVDLLKDLMDKENEVDIFAISTEGTENYYEGYTIDQVEEDFILLKDEEDDQEIFYWIPLSSIANIRMAKEIAKEPEKKGDPNKKRFGIF